MTINHIAIPPQFVAIAGEWYGGQGCMLYAVCSTGGLTTGTIRPRNDSDGSPCSDEQWYYNLWCELSGDVGRAARDAGSDHEDYTDLINFEDWIDNNVLPRLESEYNDCEGFEA